MGPVDETRLNRLRELLMRRVARGDGCWEHSGSLGSHGYPQATTPNNTSYPAHRAYWLLFIGEIPVGMFVCHRCNNRKCVRPDHLYLGTHKQNMDDMARVGHPRRALTAAQVRHVRRDPRSSLALSRELGVSATTIQNVRSGKVYRHVT